MFAARHLLAGCGLAGRMRLAVGGLLLWSAAALAWGQHNVTPDGRLLDANPAVGGRGVNPARPVSPLLRGNLTATGNVRGGLGLRSFSPISDPTAFRGGLPSANLTPFIRESVSVADAYNPAFRGGGVQPFYDPAVTAPTAEFLRGVGRYRSPLGFEPQRTQRVPGQLDFRAPTLARETLRAEPLAPYRDAQMPPAGELSSSLFGAVPLVPDMQVRLDARPRPESGYDTEFRRALNQEPTRPDEPLATDTSDPWLPMDFRLPVVALEREEQSALETALRLNPWQMLNQRADALGPRPLPEDEEPAEPQATVADPSLLPGQSVFTDLQLALSLAEDPSAPWFKELQEAIRNDPTLAEELRAAAAEEAETFVQRVLDTELATFAGKGQDAVNESLLRAELLMDAGEYYEAAREYERAAVFAPANPLPMIGRGHALLASGEYLSAAQSLLRGLERFPDLARVRVNLEALMGGGEIVDIRRADLMDLLQRNEDPQLRFLLGYLEWHSGNVESGRRNLEQAAAGAEFGSVLRRYPALLGPAGAAPGGPPRVAPPADAPPIDERPLPGERPVGGETIPNP